MLMVFDPSGKIETQTADASSPTQRRCLVTGEMKTKEHMIRFVVGPDGVVVPDIAGKLPGRGLWVSATRDALSQAVSKNMFSRAAKAKVAAPAHLIEQTETVLAKRCLDLLGLARSAGAVVTGQPQVEHALAKDELAFVLFAADAGRDCRKKLSRATAMPSGFARDALGAALGHAHLAAVGLRPHPLVAKLEKECARWQGVRGASETIPTEEELDSERS